MTQTSEPCLTDEPVAFQLSHPDYFPELHYAPLPVREDYAGWKATPLFFATPSPALAEAQAEVVRLKAALRGLLAEVDAVSARNGWCDFGERAIAHAALGDIEHG